MAERSTAWHYGIRSPRIFKCSTIRNMKTILLLLGTVFLLAHSSAAQSASDRMTMIVMRDTSPGVPAASFAAKPKTLYRIGEAYGRIEEAPDPERDFRGLIIVSEPKIWIINLRDSTGRFMIDPGPSHVFRAPVIASDGTGLEHPLRDFEYGREYEYLHSNHAGRSSETVDGKSYDKLFLAIDGYTISLLSHAGEERPYRMSVSNGQKLMLQVDYDTYLRDLEPQMSLFEPPRNTRIAELQGP